MSASITTARAADVLICGAGAAGLTLAIELARRGVAFRIIEQRDAPFPGSRGKGIQPRSQEIFEDLGVLDRLVAAGGLYPPQREYQPDGSYVESAVAEHRPATPDEPYHLPLLVPQFLTERALRERLAELGHRVEFATALVDFAQDADGVDVRLSDGSIRVRYLIGADGGRSTVRRALAIDFPGKTLGVRAVVADVALAGLDRDAWHRFNEGDMARQLSLCPLAGTALFQLQAPIPLEGDIDLSPAGLTAMVVERTARSGLAITDVAWASAFHMHARLAARYRVGRAFLVGDAAHVHPPTGGQGLNTSLQDAYNLGWKLAAVLAGAAPDLLDTYEAERRPVAEAMLGLSTALLAAAQRGDRRRGREVQQLDIGYPESPLALEQPARARGLLAGDRAPDAPLRGAAGQDVRLFALLAGPHWTLIGYRADRMAVAPRPALHIHIIGDELIDEAGHFLAAYTVAPGDWILIRPDGYIAAIVDRTSLPALESYLQRLNIIACAPVSHAA